MKNEQAIVPGSLIHMIISHAVEILQYVDCRKSLGSRGTDNVAKKKVADEFYFSFGF